MIIDSFDGPTMANMELARELRGPKGRRGARSAPGGSQLGSMHGPGRVTSRGMRGRRRTDVQGTVRGTRGVRSRSLAMGGARMRKPKTNTWTEESLEHLRHLVLSGATALRAAAALKRSVSMICHATMGAGEPA